MTKKKVAPIEQKRKGETPAAFCKEYLQNKCCLCFEGLVECKEYLQVSFKELVWGEYRPAVLCVLGWIDFIGDFIFALSLPSDESLRIPVIILVIISSFLMCCRTGTSLEKGEEYNTRNTHDMTLVVLTLVVTSYLIYASPSGWEIALSIIGVMMYCSLVGCLIEGSKGPSYSSDIPFYSFAFLWLSFNILFIIALIAVNWWDFGTVGLVVTVIGVICLPPIIYLFLVYIVRESYYSFESEKVMVQYLLCYPSKEAEPPADAEEAVLLISGRMLLTLGEDLPQQILLYLITSKNGWSTESVISFVGGILVFCWTIVDTFYACCYTEYGQTDIDLEQANEENTANSSSRKVEMVSQTMTIEQQP